jgi:D-lyxose ketol-isomerase
MLVKGLGRFLRYAELYVGQLARREPVRIGFRLTDTGEEATLGFGEGLTVEPGHVYFVPPGSVHKVRAEAGLTILWLAWDTPP